MDITRLKKSIALLVFILTQQIILSQSALLRPKRQYGAHLFMAESFIIPGGDGDSNEWGPWSAPSDCSRSCGGGVAYQSRECLNLSPDGTPQCEGGSKKYFSCNTQDCPESDQDFRKYQCSLFDRTPFEGVYYSWVPYTKAPNPCELNCMPVGERFYYRHKSKVIDGTRCNDETFDVCVDGTCQPVGCDLMLGSDAREDKCRTCQGDGTSCKTVDGLLDMDNLQVGYNDILLIPAGATNINIQERSPSNNYLAIRNLTGMYYLNGNYRIDFPRPMSFAGTIWHYERKPQGFAAPDRLHCIGPTTEAVYLVLLSQDKNVGITYEYSVPQARAPEEPDTYAWTYTQFESCSVSCGGGHQSRNVSCNSRRTLEPVDESLCDASLKPAEWQKCGIIECAPQWVEAEWSKCSKPCGSDGNQEREVLCKRVGANGTETVVDDAICLEEVGNKPATVQACNVGKICPNWFVSKWKNCDKLCGEGKQTRKVVCYRKEDDGKITILDDEECPDEKPESDRTCMLRPCEGVDYITSSWSGCDACGSTFESRIAYCASKDGTVYDEKFCENRQKPELVRPCAAPPCEYMWFTSQWSKCSAICGKGIQTRTVVCGKFDGDVVRKADDDSKCDPDLKPIDEKECEAPEDCPAQWFAGPWTKCNKKCGSGTRSRQVICIANNETVDVSKCEEDKILYSNEDCNTDPCGDDDLLPVDTTSKPLEEDDEGEEYCDEDEETAEFSGVADRMAEKDEDEDVESTTLPDGISKSTEEFTSDLTSVSVSEDTASTLESEELMFSDDPGHETTDFEDTTDIVSSGDGSSDSFDSTTEPEDKLTTIEESTSTKDDVASESTEKSVSEESSTDASTEKSSTISGEGFSVSSAETTDSETSTEKLVTDSSDATTLGEDSTEKVSTDGSSVSEDDTTVSTEKSVSDTTESKSTETTESATETTDEATETTEMADTSETTSEPASSEQTTEASSELSTATTDIETSSDASSSAISDSSASDDYDEEIKLVTDPVNPLDEVRTVTGVSTDEEETTTVSAKDEMTTTDGATESTVDVTTEQEITESEETTVEAATESTDGSTSKVDESTEAATEISDSTDATEATDSTESTTEGVTSSEESGTKKLSDYEISTDDFIEEGETTESDIEIWSTTEVTTEVTDEDLTTPNTIELAIKIELTPRKCKPRPKKPAACLTSKFGCCADNKTAATGPFDEGCPIPETCKDTKHGCCPDEVTPALGPKNKGCPESECVDTLFGCCPDGFTASEGNDNEGCPVPTTTTPVTTTTTVAPTTVPVEIETTEMSTEETVLPDCASSEFGCCQDGETVATGKDYAGCPTIECGATEFGCCSDNTTAATGPDQEGCSSCNSEMFGCCPDKVTPAHGPLGEGCCLETQFGCCPDNINSAQGPNLEGCGCQYSPYGCCPDGETSAKGHDNEGCGCQYTEFGCCLDKLTPATGHNLEGCHCHTFQFGCCPDGITVATGPHNQGCHCTQSEFGCCSDKKTKATGPNFEGCTCATSEFGCCLDGVTEAQGKNFVGCELVPESPQKACSLKKDMGTCSNFTVKYFFDTEYGGCSRFWYGGCDGNNNRFDSNEECKSVCEQPTGKDVCDLPKVVGPCTAYYPMYYYDSERNTCVQFTYGGCLGNANRFEKLEDCQNQCVADENIPECEQPIEEGPCEGSFERWGYDQERDVCIPFRYGGCKANKNNYESESACNYHCKTPGIGKKSCGLPKETGNCDEKKARWYFSQNDNKCMPFYYTGCGGNENNFESYDLCNNQCPSVRVKDACELPADVGECQNYVANWYYDTKIQRCRQFYFGGCGGNENNFRSEQDCERRCKETERRPVAPVTRPTTPVREEVTTQKSVPVVPRFDDKTRQDCLLPYDAGSGSEEIARYYYNSYYGVCSYFYYKGSEGNGNNFGTKEECDSFCKDAQDTCKLLSYYGECDNDNSTRWYYDYYDNECKEFTYGGCKGNKNNFEDRRSCERECSSRPEPEPEPQPEPEPEKQVTPEVSRPEVPRNTSLPAFCELPSLYGDCDQNIIMYFYNQEHSRCEAFYYSGCAGNDNRFITLEQCERQCGYYKDQDVCHNSRDPGPCEESETRYYYDDSRGVCESFSYGGCEGNGNRFISRYECESVCIYRFEPKSSESRAICALPADVGYCDDHSTRYRYDEDRGSCVSFIYTGCGGNLNNFKSLQACLDFCIDTEHEVPTAPVTRPTTAQPVVPEAPDCSGFDRECDSISCPYGVLKSYDSSGCVRCQCDDPCRDYSCPHDTQCSVDIQTGHDGEAIFVPICRRIQKAGYCPRLANSTSCGAECYTDADCRGDHKCCNAGCARVCVLPFTEQEPERTTSAPYPGLGAPILQPVPQEELDIEISEGGVATLKCYATGFPPPTISWRHRGIMINTNQGRFVLSSSGDLQIVQVHRTDSGVYVCIADNGQGQSVEREVQLTVADPVEIPAYIAGPKNYTIVATLSRPITLRCVAGGYPKPFVSWWREKERVALVSQRFEITRDNSLVYKSLELHDLGLYTCNAYNTIGKPIEIEVTLQAHGPVTVRREEDRKFMKYIVNPPEASTTTPTPVRTRYPSRISATTEPEPVPLIANLVLPGGKIYNTGAIVEMTCEITGQPEPEITWYKDDQLIEEGGRISIPETNRLVINGASPAESGRYKCYIRNKFSESFAEEAISVEGPYLPPGCTDNPFFANCALIVRGNYCNHKYYAKFCCKSCTLAGQLQSHPNQI